MFELAVVAPRDAFVPAPDTEVRRGPGWLQLVTPSFAQGGLNEVVHCALGEDAIDGAIDRTLAEYRARGLRYRWTVAADSAPHDLPSRLAARGLRASASTAMAHPTTATPARPAGITVEEVDGATVGAYTDVFAAGWAVAAAPLRAYHEHLLADPARRVRMYLARDRGAPVGAAGSFLLARSVHLQGAVVLPSARGRGVYRALVAARLAAAHASGRTVATTHARATTSAPILRRLGFADVAGLLVFAEP